MFLLDLPSDDFLFLFHGHIEQFKHVFEQTLLDDQIQWTLRGKRRRVIDLQQHGLAIPVRDDVEAQDLEAHEAFGIGWLASMVVMGQVLLYWKQCFYYDVFHFSHQSVCVAFVFFKSFEKHSQGSFVASVIIDIFWLLKFRAFLV